MAQEEMDSENLSKRKSLPNPTAAAASVSENPKPISTTATADMRMNLGATGSGSEASLQSNGRPRIPPPVMYPTPRIDEHLSNLSLVDRSRQEHIQSQIVTPPQLLDDTFTYGYGNSGNVTHTMGTLIDPAVLTRETLRRSTSSPASQVPTINDMNTEEEDLLNFD